MVMEEGVIWWWRRGEIWWWRRGRYGGGGGGRYGGGGGGDMVVEEGGDMVVEEGGDMVMEEGEIWWWRREIFTIEVYFKFKTFVFFENKAFKGHAIAYKKPNGRLPLKFSANSKLLNLPEDNF